MEDEKLTDKIAKTFKYNDGSTSEERQKAEKDFHEPINLFIADIRKRMNATQEAFASQIGMNLYGLRAIEHLHSYVRTHHLKNIAVAIKETPFYREYVRWMVKWIFDYDINQANENVDQSSEKISTENQELRTELELVNKKLKLQNSLVEVLQDEIKLLRTKNKK